MALPKPAYKILLFISPLAGLLCALAFPPFNLWPILIAGLVFLWLACRGLSGRRSFLLGLLWGVGLYLGAMYWLCYVMVNYGGLPPALSILLLFLLCLYLALYPAGAVFLTVWLDQYRLPRWFSAPLIWMGLECVRGYAVTGFPWLPLSLSLSAWPLWLQSAELWGGLGLSGCLVLLSALIAQALSGEKKAALYLLPALALLAGGGGGGALRLSSLAQDMSQTPSLSVSIVQGNIGLDSLWNRSLRYQHILKEIGLTYQAAGQARERPWLVLWPESAAPFAFLYDVDNSIPVLQAAADLRAYIALGTVGIVENGQKQSNRLYLIDPSGQPLAHYDKVHLVPFGEYVPWSQFLFFVRAVAALSVDMAAGEEGKVLPGGEFTAGPLICYESIFPELSRALKRSGADLLINPTNDAWFGPSTASSQHLSHLVLRAVENRLSCARSANTGISAFILPDGQVLAATELFREAVETRDIPLLRQDTFYSQYAEIFEYTFMSGAGLALLAVLVRAAVRAGRILPNLFTGKR
ncbi:MAG: apolipoprotein N-acyltransferase [Desulfarculales bacterium]|jgi:apolipoprotein N-acyltransferase|nr:apolipoprotein N-acyltransferase [Desulfarculales bacterium]